MDYRQRRKEQAQQTEQAILQAAMELARENSDKGFRPGYLPAGRALPPVPLPPLPFQGGSALRGFSPWTGTWRTLSGHETDAPQRHG